MKFEYRNGNGVLKDKVMSRFKFKFWGKSTHFLSHVKWKNFPFAITHSNIHGLGLFTDFLSNFEIGDTVGYIFIKHKNSGTFEFDYLEANLGSFINDKEDANLIAEISDTGIIIKATENINPNTVLTVNYKQLIELFPGDVSIERAIRYW